MTGLWITLRRAAIFVLFSVVCSSSVLAQQATANRNVILRRDPSTSSPALEHLQKGARLALVDAGQDSGFYHVRTDDDQVGWVLVRYVSILYLARHLPTILRPRTAVIRAYRLMSTT